MRAWWYSFSVYTSLTRKIMEQADKKTIELNKIATKQWRLQIGNIFFSVTEFNSSHSQLSNDICKYGWKAVFEISIFRRTPKMVFPFRSDGIISGSTIVGFGLQSVLSKLIRIHFTCWVLIFTGTGRWKCEEKYKSTTWFWI